jgi:hypothetical protein
MVLKYLDEKALTSVSPEEFHSMKPYPWANPYGILTEWGYKKLVSNMPDINCFEKDFGSQRKYGQTSHDRYRLWYHKTKGKVPQAWQEFINELNGQEYRNFISTLMKVTKFDLRLEWHYTVGGCSVSPHLDGVSTIGTHLFYFNLQEEWDSSWGGETLVLDERENKFGMQSSPTFEDFGVTVLKHIGNYSGLFRNQENAWHGVRELTSPPGKFRRIFSVFIEQPVSPIQKYKDRARSIIHRIKKVL